VIFETLIICASLFVVDGDTVKCSTTKQNLRLLGGGIVGVSGIDAPEKGSRAKCHRESQLSENASSRLSQLLAQGITRIEAKGIDNFGRPLVNIYMTSGSEVGQILLKEGLVKPWVRGKRNNWC